MEDVGLGPSSHRDSGTQGGLPWGGEWLEVEKRLSLRPSLQLTRLFLPPGRTAVQGEASNEAVSAQRLSEPQLCCRTELLLEASNSRS